MLDGRVLGASQVEYKPFEKPPLKRERRKKVRSNERASFLGRRSGGDLAL